MIVNEYETNKRIGCGWLMQIRLFVVPFVDSDKPDSPEKSLL